MALNTDFMVEWTDALRSGDFEKGQGQLRSSDDTYCCLGVACELLVEKNILERLEPDATYKTYRYQTIGVAHEDSGEAVLPAAAAQYMGIEVWGEFRGQDSGTRNSLTTINDRSSTTFNDVADVIDTIAFGDNGYRFAEGVFTLDEQDNRIYEVQRTYDGELDV